MTVTNGGQATANGVAPGALVATQGNVGTATLTAGPAPASAIIVAGGSATFDWTYTNTGLGAFALDGSASGTDANSGAIVTSPTATSTSSTLGLRAAPDPGPATVQAEVSLVADDPFADGTAIAQVAGWLGEAWVGPSQDGSSFARIPSAGGRPVRMGLSAGSEAGPGSVTAGAMAGVERLVFPGGGASGARFLHAALAGADPLVLGTTGLGMVLDAVQGGSPDEAPFLSSALFTAGPADRLYLGYAGPATGATLLALLRPPGLAVVEALPGASVLDLDVPAMPGASGASGILAVADLSGILYVAHDRGIARATVSLPGPAGGAPADWALATPSAAAWPAKTSVAIPALTGGALTPGARAIPALAGFGECATGICVLAARNVVGTATQPVVVPQLWTCSPSAGPAGCAPEDWTLAVPNTSGDALLTQLGDETNGAVSVLAATARWLYLGFDNGSTGVQLYRTAAAPSAAGDFKGRAGCAAGSAGCQGLGGNGFGRSGNTRVLDARVLTVGGTTALWLVVGDGSGPVAVYRVAD
jgi:hypothetical protein